MGQYWLGKTNYAGYRWATSHVAEKRLLFCVSACTCNKKTSIMQSELITYAHLLKLANVIVCMHVR